jgi:hypothetical protein
LFRIWSLALEFTSTAGVDPDAPTAVLAAMLGVSAMAAQMRWCGYRFAGLRPQR